MNHSWQEAEGNIRGVFLSSQNVALVFLGLKVDGGRRQRWVRRSLDEVAPIEVGVSPDDGVNGTASTATTAVFQQVVWRSLLCQWNPDGRGVVPAASWRPMNAFHVLDVAVHDASERVKKKACNLNDVYFRSFYFLWAKRYLYLWY